MARILINGVKAKTGGGKSILRTLLTLITKRASRQHDYFVLTPDKEEYLLFQSDRIQIVDVPNIVKSNFLFPVLYHYALPKLIDRYEIDAILNLGDIVVPAKVPQLYNFDWPHAVYLDRGAWRFMAPADYLSSKLKLAIFKRYLPDASIVMAQTEVMARRLRAHYGLDNVVLVPNAVSLDNLEGRKDIPFDLPGGKMKFVYVSHYYAHKNFEILLPVVRHIKERLLPYVIITTIAAEQHKGAERFLASIEREGLEDVLINLGPVEMSHIPSLYGQCDALLMPTLLETFGAPYIEAMFHKRAILTSDLDFARCVCGDSAVYFDPLDPSSVLGAMEQVANNAEERAERIEIGQRRLAEMWTWEQVFERYEELLGILIGEDKLPTSSARLANVN